MALSKTRSRSAQERNSGKYGWDDMPENMEYEYTVANFVARLPLHFRPKASKKIKDGSGLLFVLVRH